MYRKAAMIAAFAVKRRAVESLKGLSFRVALKSDYLSRLQRRMLSLLANMRRALAPTCKLKSCTARPDEALA
jgi:hypothetical protein